MADATAGTTRPSWLWTELFRTFQVALDPKKLLLAAGGLFCMAIATWAFSSVFFAMRSEPRQANYSVEAYQKKYDLTVEQAQKRAAEDFAADEQRYKFAYHLAGPGDSNLPEDDWRRPAGVFRAMPWNEYRGPNPFVLVKGVFHEGGFARLRRWFTNEGIPVLIEPLTKFLRPVSLMLDREADFGTRIDLVFVAIATLAVWAFFGGAITRIAVLQLAGKDPPSLVEALRFTCGKYIHYLTAPLIPILFVIGIVIITVLFGFIHLIPFLGDLVDGVLWPIPLLLGFAQALLLVGLAGYPLMFATISAEGTDTFDALSRSYNYVYQSPWAYIWNCLVAVAYGMVIVFFVVFMGSLVVYLTKWSLSQTPGTEHFASRRVEHLFIYAPTTFEWRDLLVDHPELKSYASDVERSKYLNDNLMAGNYLSAGLVWVWTTLVVLFVIGFGYSYFFTASGMIYLLMRYKVDDTELDEVYSEEDMADEPMMPPSPAPAPAPNIQMVEAPTLRPPAAPTPEPPPASP